jgi:hypothetical protein
MARRKKGGLLLGAAGVAVVGALAYGTLSSGGSTVKVADPGGGSMAAPSQAPAPYAISTLGAVGTAAQDPGGGGGGTGDPGTVGRPAIQGPQGSGSAQGYADAGDTLYFSGVNLLDPNRSAVTSGQNMFGGPSATTVVNGVGTLLGGGNDSVTGCARTSQETDYYAIPLRNDVTYRGSPRIHLNISGGGTVTVLLYQETQSKNCELVGSGTASIVGGRADVTIGTASHLFPTGVLPAVVVRANDTAAHTITTSSGNPSSIYLPNLTGV